LEIEASALNEEAFANGGELLLSEGEAVGADEGGEVGGNPCGDFLKLLAGGIAG
jgi:hypothetical protein